MADLESTFTTGALASASGFHAWRKTLLPLISAVPDPAVPLAWFGAQIKSRRLGQLAIGEATFSEHYLRCGPQRRPVVTAPLAVVACLEGRLSGTNGSRKLCLGPGDIALLDLGQTMDAQAEASRVVMVVVPRLLSDAATIDRLRHAAILSGDSLAGAVLGEQIQTIWKHVAAAPHAPDDAIRRMLIATLDNTFACDDADVPGYLAPAQQKTFHAVQGYVDRNLAELPGEVEIGERFSCSRSKMYRLFGAHGGLRRYILRERLNRCHEELTGIHGPPPRITELAIRFGFSSVSHFDRRFRDAFGVTPSTARHTGLVLAVPKGIHGWTRWSG